MFTLNCNGRMLVWEKPLIMGIINSTPDSFFEGSRFTGTDAVLAQAEKMLEEGADIIDIGGQSTRPGSTLLTATEELQRVIESVEAIHKRFPEAFISIDTFYALVAKETVAAGASIINDISAGSMDETMISMVASLNVPYVLMHMKGNPDSMQQSAHYENVTREVLDFFIHRIPIIRNAGIKDIIIDPGFGFGKTITHNFELLRNLSAFKMLDCPILLGISRKSTIYKTLDTDASQALNGTTVLNTVGIENGANILRVHDVKEAREIICLLGALHK
jgi:dihydropteroate synthase